MEDVMQAVQSVSKDLWGVWFLLGAALVFWMQAGFAMVETGFTRAKNTGNIIMKNLMDFCIGTVVFILIGFGLFLGENMLFGFLGKPNWQMQTLTGLDLYSTLYSALQQRQLFLARWQNAQSFFHTVFIQL